EQLVGVHHHHHSLSPRAPRTPTRPQPQPQPHPLLHHLPSNRFRDLHSQIHNHIHPAVPAASRVLRATPPFFLILLAAVYLLASVTIFSAPTPLLRLRLASPRPLILPKPAPPPPPPAPELFDLDGGSVRVRLTNVGAAVTSFLVPDKNGVLADVVLGFDSLDPYLNGTSPYFGCIVGRVANRIKDGKFTLNGVQYNLSINNPPNTLHGTPSIQYRCVFAHRKKRDVHHFNYLCFCSI
ncbi:Galactose mutarotase-like superfamily protein, partial [Zea mays]